MQDEGRLFALHTVLYDVRYRRNHSNVQEMEITDEQLYCSLDSRAKLYIYSLHLLSLYHPPSHRLGETRGW